MRPNKNKKQAIARNEKSHLRTDEPMLAAGDLYRGLAISLTDVVAANVFVSGKPFFP